MSDGRHASSDRVRPWVLLVECEPLARDAIAEALGEVASDVIKATDADAALRAAEANPEVPPTVLVTHTDVRAGEMDGLALAGEARRRWPDLGVVYVTERPSRLDGHVLGARDRFLPRPVARRALMCTVRGLLALPAHRAG
jgi:DNA-binding response OmpR family regulator